MIGVLGICFDIFTLNSNSITKNYISDNDLGELCLVKNYKYDDDSIVCPGVSGANFMTDEDLNLISNYCGKYYKGYLLDSLMMTDSFPLEHRSVDFTSLVSCDEELLIRYFGKDENGHAPFIAKAKEECPGSFYVTDYYIDALNAYFGTNKSYEDFVNGLWIYDLHIQFNGIIKTGYKEKFPQYKDYFFKYLNYNEYANIIEKKSYNYLRNQVDNIYLAAYSYSNTPLLDYKIYYNSTAISATIATNDKRVKIEKNLFSTDNYYYYPNYPELKDDEIILNVNDYNCLTNKECPSVPFKILDEPIEVEFNLHHPLDKAAETSLGSLKLKVVGYADRACSFVNTNTFLKINEAMNKPVKIFMVDPADKLDIYNSLRPYEIGFSFSCLLSIEANERFINVLDNMFKFIFIVLFIMVIISILYYGIRAIKNKIFEIGAMKSLGASDLDIILQVGINIIITSIMLILFYNVLEIALVNVVNNILVKSLNSVSKEYCYLYFGFHLIKVTPKFIGFTDLFIFVGMLLSLIIPYIRIRNLKPTNIIKAKE